VTFGSVTATVPTAAPIYKVALDSVAGLPARVLLTTGEAIDEQGLAPPGPHVHVARWVAQADVLPHARVVVSCRSYVPQKVRYAPKLGGAGAAYGSRPGRSSNG
jgi:hypothetical protein